MSNGTKLNWFITGGCGFIGINLVDLLLKSKDNRITVFDNLSVGQIQNLERVCSENKCTLSLPISSQEKWSQPVTFVKGDIVNSSDLEAASQGADVFIHLAANAGVQQSIENPVSDLNINVVGTVNALEAARKNQTKKFIFASSGASVGSCTPPIHELLPAHPLSPYGAGKLAGEGYCMAYHASFDIGTICLRFGNVYGPRSTHKGSVVAKFIKQAIQNQTWSVFGSGNQTRDFIYIDDLTNAIYSAALSDIGGEVFQIASQKETSINELIIELKKQLSLYSINTSTQIAPPLTGEVARNFSDISKANKLLHWKPKVALDEGLKRTIEWFITSRTLI